MADTAKNVPRITAEEYFKLTADREERTELLDGEIVAMASPSIRHQDIASGLITELRQFVKRSGGRCRPFAAPTDVRLDDLNVLVPDVFVSCDPERFGEQYHNGAPDFVVEIVSTNPKEIALKSRSIAIMSHFVSYSPKKHRSPSGIETGGASV